MTPTSDVETKIDQDVEAALSYLIRTREIEDKPDRDYRLLLCRKREYYWNGIQNLAYDYVRRDWVDLGDVVGGRGLDVTDDTEELPRHNNIFKGLGQSIISALTAELPILRYFPEDALDPNDILTAKSYSRIEELIANRNEALQLLRKALYIRYTQDYVLFYNYRLADAKKYGSIEENVYGFQKEDRYDHTCPECMADMGAESEMPMMGEQACPECQQNVVPNIDPYKIKIPVITKQVTTPKSTEILEVYGQTHVKIPMKAANIKECGYLILACEQPWTRMVDIYPHLKGKIGPSNPTDDINDRQAREPVLSPSYHDISSVTYKRIWLRPWEFNLIDDEEIVKELKDKYPDGCCVSYVNEYFAEIYPEDMDEHWTLNQPPTALKVIEAPLGEDVIPMQDSKNEVFNLLIECLKYGIPITMVDPRVINFEAYQQMDSKPGSIIPAKIPPGFQSLDAGIKVLQTAQMPADAYRLDEMVDKSAQFASGALPPIWGAGGKSAPTLGQSEMDYNQALGRLNLVWSEIVDLYRRTMEKAIPDFANGLLEDEKFTKEVGQGNFINVWIRKSELEGKVGKVTAESSNEFPVSWVQKRNTIFQLIQMGNDAINSVIFHPNNVQFVSETIGIPSLYVPGQDQRYKQLVEITQLAASAPTPQMDPVSGEPILGPDGQPVQNPTVPVNPQLDDHNIHITTCQEIMNSEVGMEMQQSNPQGYQNIMLHLQQHMQILQQQQMQQAQAQQQQQMQQEAQKAAVKNQGSPPVGEQNGNNPPAQ